MTRSVQSTGYALDPRACKWVPVLRARLGDDKAATVGPKGIAVQEVAARIRALGIEPHPWGEAFDDEFCANVGRLRRAAEQRTFQRLRTSPDLAPDRTRARLAERRTGVESEDASEDVPAGTFRSNVTAAQPEPELAVAFAEGSDTGEESGPSYLAGDFTVSPGVVTHLPSGDLPGETRVAPNHQVGINKGRFPLTSEDEIETYGHAADIVNDIAEAGGGVVRQVEACDLLWLEMFNCDSGWSAGHIEDTIDDAIIPPPNELLERLTDSGFAAFSKFTELLIYCIAADVQVIPTLFTLGGGNRYNEDHDRFFCVRSGEDAVQVDDVNDGIPSHQSKAVIPSAAGWDPFYWDPDETGHSDVDPDEKNFQRFALNLYSSSNEGLTRDDDFYDQTGQYTYPMHPYGKECARRKCLAVAAFGQAVGEFLAATQALIALFYNGKDFREVIPYLECGNEFDGSWMKSRGNVTDGPSEMGSFHALLAGPILRAQPRARLRAAGLSSATSEDKWADRLSWMRTAYGEGLEDEVDRWRDYLGDVECLLDAGEFTELCYRIENTVAKGQGFWWWRTCFEANFFWPPLEPSLTFDAHDMLHQVGHHWYHSWDSDESGAYMDQTEMLSDLQEFIDEVVKNLQVRGYGLTWEMSEIGFPAKEPPDWAKDEEGMLQWNSHASPMMQAGMCVRYILTVLSLKPQMMLWHTHLSKIANDSPRDPGDTKWTIFSSMGVRADTGPNGGEGFARADRAWRRPSWYSFRRLMWLLKRTDEIDVVTNENGTVVVRLKSERGFTTSAMGPSYRRAYVAWVDQSRPGVTYAFSIAAGTGSWERLSLVPEVVLPTTPELDENGYPSGDTPEWRWDGWDAAAITERAAGRRKFLDIVIAAADGLTNPAPLCVLVREDVGDGADIPLDPGQISLGVP